MTDDRLFIGCIMGLGQSADGDLLGLREFLTAQNVASGNRIDLLTASHATNSELEAIAEATNRYAHSMLIGHSFGGDEAWQIASGRHGPIGLIDRLFLLDPKPESFGQWINPFFKYQLPPGVGHCTSVHGGFGCAFVEGGTNIKFPIGHSEFPGNPESQLLIAGEIVDEFKLMDTVPGSLSL